MKLLSGILVSLFLLFAGAAQAAPIDLSGFTALPSADYVVISDSIFITEVDAIGAYFAVDEDFAVPDDAGMLTFILSMDPSPADYDWFVVRINDFPNAFFEANESQSGSVDLSPFRGQTISLAFGLESDDWVGGTEGTFSRIDLGTSSVPEPSTLLLLGIGLAGFVGMRRRMHSRRA